MGDADRRNDRIDPHHASEARHSLQVSLQNVGRDHAADDRDATDRELDRTCTRAPQRLELARPDPLLEPNGGAHRRVAAREEQAG